jgi:hypothetical protein
VSVSVYVMPLATYLRGEFRVSWGPDGAGPLPLPLLRSPEEVEGAVAALLDRLEQLLAFRPTWDDSGPVRSATVFSLEGFSAPFLDARRRGARKLPLLRGLEPPQIWIPPEFEPAFRIETPWSPGIPWVVASAPRLHAELVRLLEEIDVDEVRRVTLRLLEILKEGIENDQPVIVEI